MGRYAGKSAQEVCKDLLKAAPETVKDVRELYKEVEDEKHCISES